MVPSDVVRITVIVGRPACFQVMESPDNFTIRASFISLEGIVIEYCKCQHCEYRRIVRVCRYREGEKEKERDMHT